MRLGTEDSKIRSKGWATQICEVQCLYLRPDSLFSCSWENSTWFLHFHSKIQKHFLSHFLHLPHSCLGSGSASALRGDSAVRNAFQIQTCRPLQLRAGAVCVQPRSSWRQHDEMAAVPRATSASAGRLYHVCPCSTISSAARLPAPGLDLCSWSFPSEALPASPPSHHLSGSCLCPSADHSENGGSMLWEVPGRRWDCCLPNTGYFYTLGVTMWGFPYLHCFVTPSPISDYGLGYKSGTRRRQAAQEEMLREVPTSTTGSPHEPLRAGNCNFSVLCI